MSQLMEKTDTFTVDAASAAYWEWCGGPNPKDPDDEQWSRADIETVVERVNRGASLLDEQNPGWESKVHPGQLDMASSGWCIVGQIYGDFDECVGMPFGMGMFADVDDMAGDAVDHGFLTQCRPPGAERESIPYTLLDFVWVYLLNTRAAVNNAKVFLTLPPQTSRNVMIETLVKNKLITI